MCLFGVEVVGVDVGSCIFKDVINEVLCDWVVIFENMYYVFGLVFGLELYFCMVCDFYCIIGEEVCKQLCKQVGKVLFDVVVVCVGGGSNVIGFFYNFFGDFLVCFIGVEVGGCGEELGEYVLCFDGGVVGVLYGICMFVFQDD